MLMSLTPGVLFTQEAFGPCGFSGTRGWDVNNKLQDQRRPRRAESVPAEWRTDQRQGRQLAVRAQRGSGAGIQGHDQHLRFLLRTLRRRRGQYDDQERQATTGTAAPSTTSATPCSTPTARKTSRPHEQVRPPHNQHQFGGVIGGALRKNKDFVFGSFEGWREVQPASVISSVPAPNLMRWPTLHRLRLSRFTTR